MSQYFEQSTFSGVLHQESIVQFSAIASRASSARYRIPAMSIDHPSAGLVLKSIRIRLIPEAGHQTADARQELVLSALAAVLIAASYDMSPAWTVQAVPGADPLLYDLTPLPDHPVSADEALKMSNALCSQSRVADATPIFVAANGRPSESPHT